VREDDSEKKNTGIIRRCGGKKGRGHQRVRSSALGSAEPNQKVGERLSIVLGLANCTGVKSDGKISKEKIRLLENLGRKI